MTSIPLGFELPIGWEEVTVRDVSSKVQYGTSAKPTENGGGIPILRMGNIQAGSLVLSNLKYVSEAEEDFTSLLLTSGDILFNRTNSPELVGKAALFREKLRATFASYLIRVQTDPALALPTFVCFWINSPWGRDWARQVRSDGVSQSNINSSKLLAMALPLPPLVEQRRIVAAVEVVLAKVNAARDRLNRVPAILKRFRQAVLSAACSGRLTADWREKNPTVAVSPEAAAKTELQKPDDWPDELPDGWRVGSMAAISSDVVDCPHSTPKWTTAGEICLRTTNFLPGCLDLSEVRYVSVETFQDRINRLQPEAGDIVYSREGGILGIACMMPDGLRACLGQRMMLMRVHPWMNSTFVMHVLNSSATLAVVKELTGGTASPHLNVGDVKAFRIPVPPLAEQQEIVRRVGKLFALADVIEARLTDARQMADQLTQAVLAKAFRGELVPTEAALARREKRTYEPAADLLARIRAQRDQPAAPANGNPTRTRKRKPDPA